MWLHLLVLVVIIFLYRWYRYSLTLENLSDKYVLITGCDSGFGNQLAKRLDELGMRVLATCLTEQGADNLKKETSSRLQTVILDIANTSSVHSVATWVSNILGEKDLWGLVNNAGTGMPGAPNEWLSREDFAKVLNVNLLGPIDVTLKLLPLLRKSKGRIVNVSSIVGRVTFCGGGYCISKFGVEAFSDSLRREMKPFGVEVSIIEPGYFRTGLNNMQNMKDTLKKMWRNVHPEIRYSYGEEYFHNYVSDLERTFLSFSKEDLTPVTDCMVHALTAVHPKTRYSAGWDAQLFYVPLSYVPTFLADFLLTRAAPTPAH